MLAAQAHIQVGSLHLFVAFYTHNTSIIKMKWCAKQIHCEIFSLQKTSLLTEKKGHLICWEIKDFQKQTEHCLRFECKRNRQNRINIVILRCIQCE